MTTTDQIRENLAIVRERISHSCERAGRTVDEVRLIAVSKYRPLEQTKILYDQGIRDFGENRVQEGREKIPELPDDICWHLIGPLQTNKTKYLPGKFSQIHSVERLKVAKTLEKEYAESGLKVTAFVQVNIAGEDQKSGCSPDEAESLVKQVVALEHVELAGLMTMAPYYDEPERTRPVFRALRELRDRIRDATGVALPRLSMGMTNDFEVAVEEGATDVRVGTALYEGRSS